MNEKPAKLSLGTKIGYAMGDFGNNFSWTFVSSYLLYFYTDVFGVSAAAVSLLLIISRIWDAVNDPIVGSLADRTRSKYGRYRPWALAAVPTAILLVITFWNHPAMSSGGKVVYLYVSYCLLVLAYTCVNLPYGTLAGSITGDIEERGQLSTFRIFGAHSAQSIIGMLVIPLVTLFGRGNESRGYLCTAIVFGLIIMICHGIVFKSCKETVEPPKQKKYPTKVNFKSLLHNKPFVLACLIQVLFGFMIYGRGAVLMYYFKYVCGDENFMTTYNLVGIAPLLIGTAAFPFVYKTIGKNNKAYAGGIGIILMGLALVGMYFVHPGTSMAWLFYVCVIFVQFGCALFATGSYAIITDCADYGQWKTGVRNDGFQYAFISFGNKVGMAIATSGAAAILAAVGYVANQTQSETVLNVINLMSTIIPAIFAFAMAVCFFLYKIDKNLFEKITADIANRTPEEEKALWATVGYFPEEEEA